MFKFISIILVFLAVLVFSFTGNKAEFVANGFGAFFGVGLGVCIDRWWEEEKRKRSLKTFLRYCIQLTNSNIGKINDVINRYGVLNNSEGKIRGAFVDLLSGIPHESYASFLETGLQSDLKDKDYNFQNKFLFCRASIVDLHGYVAGRNSMPSSYFQSGSIINSEWAELVSRLRNVETLLKELKKLIEGFLDKSGEKNYQ